MAEHTPTEHGEELKADGTQKAEDRVNNRSLRPNSDSFKDFMTSSWDNQEPEVKPVSYTHL